MWLLLVGVSLSALSALCATCEAFSLVSCSLLVGVLLGSGVWSLVFLWVLFLDAALLCWVHFLAAPLLGCYRGSVSGFGFLTHPVSGWVRFLGDDLPLAGTALAHHLCVFAFRLFGCSFFFLVHSL